MRVWIAVCVLFSPLVVGELNDETFRRIQKSHKSSTLTTGKVRTLAQKSDRRYFENDLLDPMMVVRDVGSVGHTNTRHHIVNYMKSLGWHVEENRFDDQVPKHGLKTFTNIIATQKPNAPSRLVFACHYDSKYFSSFNFYGMSDSAVPCAMLLDLGRTLNESIWKAPGSKAAHLSLQFIFFDGEEAFVSWTKTDSLYGSRHLAEKWEREKTQLYREVEPLTTNQRIAAFVLLDLIGYQNPQFKNWFDSTSNLFERLKKIELRLAKYNLLEGISSESRSSQYFTGGQLQGFGIEDDHVPFKERGVPILHLIAYPFPSVWHKPDDNKANFDPVSTDNLLKIFRVMIAEYLYLNV